MQPAVFLDRDNTLIANDGDLGDPTRVQLLEGVADGLKALRQAGYRLVVVTNQGGVARGQFTEADVDAVHRRIAELVDTTASSNRVIERFYYCPYHPEGDVEEYRRDHPWRKPRAGMLRQAARDMDLDLTQSWMIGDQSRDVKAGEAAGCRTVIINGTSREGEPAATVAVTTFSEAVHEILKSSAPRARSTSRPAWRPVAKTTKSATPQYDLEDLRRAVAELTDEIRSQRVRGAEFTGLKMIACIGQMLAVILALLGLLQLGQTEVFVKWMLGAALVQLVTIALLLLDLKG